MSCKQVVRPCGSSWEYCNGICTGCVKSKIKTSNITNTITSYPKYSYNSGICYSDGEPCYGEDLDYIFNEVKNESK